MKSKPVATRPSAPANRPQPSKPNGGSTVANRPNAGSNNGNKPNVSKPNGNRPNTGNGNTVNRPNVSGNGNTINKGGNTINKGGNTNVVRNTNVNNVNVNRNYGNRAVVVNPVYHSGPAWGWNHGSAWYPAPNYWGGGFWGSLAITAAGAATAAAVYGSITNSQTHTTYTSYQAQPNSPGATLL